MIDLMRTLLTMEGAPQQHRGDRASSGAALQEGPRFHLVAESEARQIPLKAPPRTFQAWDTFPVLVLESSSPPPIPFLPLFQSLRPLPCIRTGESRANPPNCTAILCPPRVFPSACRSKNGRRVQGVKGAEHAQPAKKPVVAAAVRGAPHSRGSRECA